MSNFSSFHFLSFHFLRPEWFLLLLPVLGLLALLWRLKSKNTAWQKVCDPHLLDQLLTKQTKGAKRGWVWLLALAWILSIVAMAGPTWRQQPQPVFRSMVGSVIVLDVSPNMLAADIPPSRLQRAKFKILDYLRQLKDGQIGMAVFAGEGHIVSPLTSDAETIASMVPVLSPNIMPVPGDDMAAGLKLGMTLLQRDQLNKGKIILVTASKPDADAMTMAKQLLKAGFHLDVLAVGTESGAPIPMAKGGFQQSATGSVLMSKLPVSALKMLAALGGGDYIPFSNSNADIQQLLSQTNRGSFSSPKRKTQDKATRWFDEGQWFLLPLLLLGLFGFRRGYWQ